MVKIMKFTRKRGIKIRKNMGISYTKLFRQIWIEPPTLLCESAGQRNVIYVGFKAGH